LYIAIAILSLILGLSEIPDNIKRWKEWYTKLSERGILRFFLIFAGSAGLIYFSQLHLVETKMHSIPPIPPGAVVAFEAEKCPDGWKLYHEGAGRFLFGADNDHELRSIGGKKKHQLTMDEMPRHRHDDSPDEGKARHLLVQVTGTLTEANTDPHGDDQFNIRHGVRMKARGKGLAHENMPPYRVVNFCEKK